MSPTPLGTTGGELLVLPLDVAVLMAVHALQRRNGPEIRDLPSAAATTVVTYADELQFGGTHGRGTVVALAEGLAACVFAPGGVALYGYHRCALHHDLIHAPGPWPRPRSAADA